MWDGNLDDPDLFIPPSLASKEPLREVRVTGFEHEVEDYTSLWEQVETRSPASSSSSSSSFASWRQQSVPSGRAWSWGGDGTLQFVPTPAEAADEAETARREARQTEGEEEEGPARPDGAYVWGRGDDDDDWDESDGDEGVQARARASVSNEVRAFDTARIKVEAGMGGNGCVSFRREKFVEFGGPNGGNGGRGGHVWAVADRNCSSLLHFRGKVHWKAGKGLAGSGGNRTGAGGNDVEIAVPVGTVIRERTSALDTRYELDSSVATAAAVDENDDADDQGAVVAELLEDGERALLAVGGKGGRGNASFKSNMNRAPTLAEVGERGVEKWLSLELKVVADVGIVGCPNAGKSTLLSVLSAARPKIANYPFTTLVPNLGVCDLDMRTTVFADIPGLLEGAHTGHGLGIAFLRHCERARMLVHVLDGSTRDPIHDFEAIRTELELFDPELAEKPYLVVYSKMDVPESSDYYDLVAEYFTTRGLPAPMPLSGVTGKGVTEMVRAVRRVLDALPPSDLSASRTVENVTEVPRKSMRARIDDYDVDVDRTVTPWIYTVRGEALARFTAMTNFDYFEGLLRYQRVLEAAGVVTRLAKEGIREGDTVDIVGGMSFEWKEDRSQGSMYDAWKGGRNKQAPHAR